MVWLESILNTIIAGGIASVVLAGVNAIVGAVLGPLLFGRNYKQRIAALETHHSQPVVNVFAGEERSTGVTGDISEIRTLTQAEYDALANKNKTTLYLIVNKH